VDIFDEARSIERPQFFDGQQLFASDLEDIVSLHRRMRWLHNRSLHQPGIGNGFAVAGRRGDREVLVQPGYALDCFGREIALVAAERLPVPPVAAEPDGSSVWFDLTASYPADKDLDEVESRAGVCVRGGVIRRREHPVLCWVRLKRDPTGDPRPVSSTHAQAIQDARELVLARIEVRQCMLESDLSTIQRRNARPPQLPRVVCGSQDAAWTPWNVVTGGYQAYLVSPVGLKAAVDTREGTFRVTPSYTGRVAGLRPLEVTIPVVGNDDRVLYVLDLAGYVQNPTPEGFDLYVPLTSLSRYDDVDIDDDDIGTIAEAARDAWGVTWMAVEG
jgi:hypothetical protein